MTDRPIPPAHALTGLLNQAWADLHHLAQGDYARAEQMLRDHDPALVQWQRIAIEERAEVRGRPLVSGSSGSGHSDPTAHAVVGPEGSTLDTQHAELVATSLAIRESVGWLMAAITMALHDCRIEDYLPPDLTQAADDVEWCCTIPHSAAEAHRTLHQLERHEDARQLRHAVGLIRDEAQHLRGMASRTLSDATRKELHPEQPKLRECIVHARHGYKGVLANSVRDKNRCEDCATFNRNNRRTDPTAAILKRWEYGQPATPGQIAEARAAKSAKKRERAS